MSPADAVLLIPTGIGIAAAIGYYLFARSIGRRQQAAQAAQPLAASEVAADAPFEVEPGGEVLVTVQKVPRMRGNKKGIIDILSPRGIIESGVLGAPRKGAEKQKA